MFVYHSHFTALQVKVILWIPSFTGLNSKVVASVSDDELTRTVPGSSSHNSSLTLITVVQFITAFSPTMSVSLKISTPVVYNHAINQSFPG